MNNFEEALRQLRDLLFQNAAVQSYLSLQKEMSDNADLQALQRDLQAHQRAMSLAMDNEEVYQQEKKQYLAVKEQLDVHPLMQNMRIVHEEVHALLAQIKSLLEK